MKVYELIEDDKPAELHHPKLGNVDWKDPGNGYGYTLTWADGPEKGMDLAVDPTVLFDDQWELRK